MGQSSVVVGGMYGGEGYGRSERTESVKGWVFMASLPQWNIPAAFLSYTLFSLVCTCHTRRIL